MKALESFRQICVSTDCQGPLGAEIPIVLEYHHARLAGSHRLKNPVIKAIDIKRKQINFTCEPMSIYYRIDIFRRYRDSFERHPIVTAVLSSCLGNLCRVDVNHQTPPAKFLRQ